MRRLKSIGADRKRKKLGAQRRTHSEFIGQNVLAPRINHRGYAKQETLLARACGGRTAQNHSIKKRKARFGHPYEIARLTRRCEIKQKGGARFLAGPAAAKSKGPPTKSCAKEMLNRLLTRRLLPQKPGRGEESRQEIDILKAKQKKRRLGRVQHGGLQSDNK